MKEWLKERWESFKKWAVDDVMKTLYKKAKELLKKLWDKMKGLVKK